MNPTEADKNVYKTILAAASQVGGQRRGIRIEDVLAADENKLKDKKWLQAGDVRQQIWELQRKHLIKLGLLGSPADRLQARILFAALSKLPDEDDGDEPRVNPFIAIGGALGQDVTGGGGGAWIRNDNAITQHPLTVDVNNWVVTAPPIQVTQQFMQVAEAEQQRVIAPEINAAQLRLAIEQQEAQRATEVNVDEIRRQIQARLLTLTNQAARTLNAEFDAINRQQAIIQDIARTDTVPPPPAPPDPPPGANPA